MEAHFAEYHGARDRPHDITCRGLEQVAKCGGALALGISRQEIRDGCDPPLRAPPDQRENKRGEGENDDDPHCSQEEDP